MKLTKLQAETRFWILYIMKKVAKHLNKLIHSEYWLDAGQMELVRVLTPTKNWVFGYI
jgi:hypothetical protein